MIERTQFTFYESFYKAISRIKNDSDRAKTYDAICAYALYGTMPVLDELPDAAAIAFELVKPNLDASRKKAEGGKKGRPLKDKEKIPERCDKDTGNEKEKEKEIEKEDEKEKENEIEIEDECLIDIPPAPSAPAPPSASVPYETIKNLYNEICTSFPKCTVMSDARKKAVKARFSSGYTLEHFKVLFTKAEASSFLKGKNDRSWTANLDWLIKDANMAKVLDGNYDDHGRGKPIEYGTGFETSNPFMEMLNERRDRQ